jgi:hypothetical protein
MNAPGYTRPITVTPWQRYLAREHAARDAYIATMQHAHFEYLTGPWPDRAAYTAIEASAWTTYYSAGRGAWQAYRRETDTPPAPPRPADASTYPYPVGLSAMPNSKPWPAGAAVPSNPERRS